MRLSTDTAARVTYPRMDSPSAAAERSRGFNQGHAAGYTAGLKKAAVEAETARLAFAAEREEFLTRSARQLAAQISLLETITARTAAAAVPVLEAAELTLAEAGLHLAETVLGTELSNAHTAARAALGRAFPSEEPAPPLNIRLHPADVQLLTGTTAAAGIVLVEDPSLQRGDALAAYPDGMIDARIGAALERARTALEGTGA